jgi:cytochrome c-type biogenesis protein CcmH
LRDDCVDDEVNLHMYKPHSKCYGKQYGQRWWAAVLLFALLVGGAWAVGGRVALAQSSAPAAAAPLREVTPDEVNRVAREIWCPLCSGVRLDACELKACQQMKEVIAIKLAEGEDTASIKAYFVEQYGPQVMGEPPRAGFNWLAWILPGVAVVAGGYFFWRTTQRMMAPADGVNSVDGGLDASPLPRPTPANSAIKRNQGGALAGEEDEYARKLDEELAKYG